MKKFLLLISLLTVISSLLAHEFWLQPDKFIYKRGEPVNIKFLVGENFEGENWKGDSSKVNKLTFYYGGVKDEISPSQLSDKGDSLQIQQYDEGTCMVTFNSSNSYIILDSAKFNAYLSEDGLADAIEYRKTHNETDSTGREYYQRSVKTIFQVSTVKDETYKQTTSLPVDIIPLSHPYKIIDSSVVSFKILFQNKPLANTAIKIWHRVNDETAKQEIISDDNGTISFRVSTNGRWMVSCVKMVRIENNPAAQWQSYWGSCTWGYY